MYETKITITIRHRQNVSDLPAKMAALNATQEALRSTRWHAVDVATDVEVVA